MTVITLPFTSKYRFVKTVGKSMEPTLKDGEWVVMERPYSLGKDWLPLRYDNVVIENDGEKLSKRIIGLPGDTIEVSKGVIYLNDEILRDPYSGGRIEFDSIGENRYLTQKKEVVPSGYVWVIGDNREDSWFGLLPVKCIVGRILY